MSATTPRSRGIWARRGLGCRARIDRTTQSMLLRQLYLSHFEQEHFKEAFHVSEQSLRLGVMLDVVHQDAARACVGLGDVDLAAQHLRRAARVGPASRRAFHLWSLGSIYFVAGRHSEAIAALMRAARWGTRDKPLYQGHLALARIASGERVDELPKLSERLRSVPAGQGYGRFVLGHMAYHSRRYREAREHLEAFVARSEGGRPALAIALGGELAIAKKTLARMTRS
jgi:tetratricopeptide (TPR) repeat protein